MAILSILLFISSFFCLFNLTTDLNINFIDRSDFSQDHETNNDFELELSDSSLLSIYSGVGKAQNVTEYGEGYFLNKNINVSDNENATVIVPYEWEAIEINSTILSIHESDSIWMNETFDTGVDYTRWTNHTDSTHTDYIETNWYQNPLGSNDSIALSLLHIDIADDWDNIDSYLNYTFYLDRENVEFQYWDLDFTFKFIEYEDPWLNPLVNSRFTCAIKMGQNSQSFNLDKLSDFTNNTWYNSGTDPFIPELSDLNPPGELNVIFNIATFESVNPNGKLTLYIDNVTLTMHTIPKPTSINLNTTDYEHSASTPIIDIGYGNGYALLFNSWYGEVGGEEYRFGFSSNSTGSLEISSEQHIKAIRYGFTRIMQTNIKGSEFFVENDSTTTWTMYIPVSIPGSYSTNYYLNVSKPLNWNVTQVIDPYSNNKINEVIGAGVGNSTLTIPNTIITEGVWEIVAEAPNYIELANLFKKNTLQWSKNDTFYTNDDLKINATIKTALIPNIDGTTGMLKIFSPNGSLWYQEGDVSVDINGNVEFSKITLGTNNASTGKYFAQIIWHDNNINISQVGFSLLQFNVIHKTNLTAIDSYFNQLSGDPLLLRVKFLDSDFNQSIQFATVTYSSTFGTYGSMIYQGSGRYFIDIDTSSLSSGDYYFSFNASKSFYENQTMLNLIHLNIIENVNLTTYVNYQEIHEDYLVELSYNQEIEISCRALADIEGVFLSGGSITFINGEYEVELYENADYWFNRTIPISISSFSIGPNYAYLRFQQSNYTTTIFTFQVFVNQMEINVGTPDFEGLISGVSGETILIKLNLTETGSTNYIENATVFYSWNFGAGYFNDIGSGIYELELPLPTGFGGNYDFKLIISKEGVIYKTKEFTFFIDINQVEGPDLFILMIIFVLIALIGILGALSLRSYVILPKRRKRKTELISKVQVYKDVWNIRAVILIHKLSGLPIYSKDISIMGMDHDSTLISGFIQAVTAFSESLVDKEFKTYSKLATDYEYLKTIIDLDFKFFQLLVCDFEAIRVLLILRDSASERLKKQLYLLASVIYSQFSKQINKFYGSLSHIHNELQDIINQLLFLHYNGEFEITPNRNYYNSILESGELTNLERRLINIISSMIKINKTFTLKAVIDLIDEIDEDLVLEALNSLISRKIILSPYSPKLKQKKSRV